VKLLKKERVLLLTFNDGKQFRYPAEFLRVESPSAEVQGKKNTHENMMCLF